MPAKKPPFTHREMAKLLFTPSPHENRIPIIPTWLKIEFYSIFFEILPHLITIAVWFVIAAGFYWAMLLI
jgi:hypothetical protein